MALTEKGQAALKYIQKFYEEENIFTAKNLSEKCGVKIVAATLNSLANNGYLDKLGGSPIEYKMVSEFKDLMDLLEQEETSKGCNNSNLQSAKRVKNDEFYTRYEDIEAEVMKYRKQFQDKIVYLPCDDPAEKKSEFWSFFVNNFDAFGLKKLIATHYDENGKAYKIWIDGDTSGDGYIDDGDALQETLQGNGDFQSPECIEIMKECDIVCTNPPFSLFREFVTTILTHKKQFLIIGNKNAFTYKEIFPLIQSNQIWIGYTQPKDFKTPEGTTHRVNGLSRWFTNLKVTKRNDEEFIFTEKYDPIKYPKYNNYNVIEVGQVAQIPEDYYGVMGVPVTFIDKYNPNQFELIGMAEDNGRGFSGDAAEWDGKNPHCIIGNQKPKYKRIFIRHIKNT